MGPSYSRMRVEREPWFLPVDSLVLLFQLVMAGLVLGAGLDGEMRGKLLAFHGLFAATLVVFLWNAREWENPFLRLVRETYPILTVILFYKETGLLVHSYVGDSLDERLLSWDLALGGIGTSLWNLQRFHPPPRFLNEIFGIGYAFYFLLIPLSILVLFNAAPRAKFRGFLFTLSLVFYLHYLAFILFPADSPRFYVPGLREPLEGYLVCDLLRTAVEGNAYPGGSFPSSHVAGAVVALSALPYLGKWKGAVLGLAFLMALGTLYGRYHYFVDVLAGLAVGLTCLFLGPWLERIWPLVFDEEGLARDRRKAFDRG